MHVIDFTSEGTAQAMHSDKFPLAFLGAQSITRATDIKFNEDTQTWGLYLPSDIGTWEGVPEAQGFDTYEGARKVEVRWLNVCRLRGVNPESNDGLSALKLIRRAVALTE